MRKLMILVLALMMLAGAAAAETKITVSGTGETRISADTAVISLGVNARDRDVLAAQKKVNEAIAAIRKALAEKGVKEEDTSTEYINIYAIYDYKGDQEQLAAYNASSTLAIRVTDPELLAKTGGIVQGMSGSPIIQNGRIVGAVTHV